MKRRSKSRVLRQTLTETPQCLLWLQQWIFNVVLGQDLHQLDTGPDATQRRHENRREKENRCARRTHAGSYLLVGKLYRTRFDDVSKKHNQITVDRSRAVTLSHSRFGSNCIYKRSCRF